MSFISTITSYQSYLFNLNLRYCTPIAQAVGLVTNGLTLFPAEILAAADLQKGRKFRDLSEELPESEQWSIRQDIRVIDSEMPSAKGCNHNIGFPFITMPTGLETIEPDGYRTILKHEMVHIQNSDGLHRTSIGLITSIAATYFAKGYLSFAATFRGSLSTFLLTYTITSLFTGIYGRVSERKAEDIAIKRSTTEELVSYRRILAGMMKASKSQSPKWTAKDGTSLFDFEHYPWSTILSKVEIALEAKNVVLEDLEGENVREKIGEIKEYFINLPKQQ